MASKWIHFVLFAVLFYISGATEEDDISNANDYVDTVLDNLRKETEFVKYLDPLSVPDVHDSQYSLKNMRIRGLSNLKRHEDCTLSYDGSTVNVVAEVAVASVTIHFDYSAKVFFFWIHGGGEVAFDDLAVKLDLSSTDGNARLNSFKVVNLENYYVKSITLPYFLGNWLVRFVAKSAAHIACQNIIDALEYVVKNTLDNVLKQYKLPIN